MCFTSLPLCSKCNIALVCRHGNCICMFNLSQAWQHWANGTALELLDPTAGNQFPRYEVLKCIQIGLMCVQDGPADRPSMSEVIVMLSSYTISSPAPARPAFYVPMEKQEPGSAKGNSNASSSDQFKTSSVQGSANEVTISEFYPR